MHAEKIYMPPSFSRWPIQFPGSRGAHVKNLWGGGVVGHSGPTFYKNIFAKASCHRCTDLYFYPRG